MTGVHHYKLYGLKIVSDLMLALPEQTRSVPDVIISHREELEIAPVASNISSDESGVEIIIADVACYRIVAGRHIEVSSAASTVPSELALFLLGSAFGVLLQQRGILALHANATSDGKRAVAIAGVSGAGKSTFAAQLCGAGMALMSDDVCAIEMIEGEALALPGVPRVRLWPDSSERLEWSTAHATKVSPRIEKFEFEAPSFAAAPLPLAGIYILGRCDAQSAPGFHRLTGSDAVAALMQNSYRGDLLAFSGAQVGHFERSIALARATPIFLWRRNWGTQYSSIDLASFLEHFRKLD